MALPSNAHLIWHPFVGYCRHDYMVAAVPTIWNFIDFDIVHGVTGMFAWPTASFPYPPALKPSEGGILAMGVPMEGRDTDASFIVPHVPVPLVPSWLLLLIIMFGSSKIIMGSNKTRIWCRGLSPMTGEAEQAVGCCIIPYVPISLNLQCWDMKCKKYDVVIGAPMLSDLVVAPNTMQVGINFSDYMAAMLDWAIDVALALIIAFGTKGAGSAWDKYSAAKVKKAGDKAAAKALKEAGEKELSEEATNAAVKAAREAAEKKAAEPGWFGSRWYHKIADKKYGKQFLVGLVVKLPHRLIVKNSEWYREDIQRPLEKKLPEI